MVSIHPRRLQALRQFVLKLGIDENPVLNWELLDTALTHPTASAERNYERLEFIGDAAIRLASAELLWEIYPQVPVGDYAAIRSVLVSDRVLADIAESYGLDRYLLVANSAAGDKAGYRSRLADGMEAVAAALYLSTHTTELIRPWLDSHFKPLAERVLRDPARQNYKAALQEWTQGRYRVLPEYRVEEAKREHNSDRRFQAEVWFNNERLGRGTGRSIKAAEQAAAREAFLALQDRAEVR
ncbi:MAG: ribonuclease III [Cyanobacteria bacterium SID2]|nr:ribonuclease III [Cyanobacteria bacterium SID2]MBP0006269.1 ribonuclease III [Cyanobacteria bacterium SBC]